ncbi:hypothetical protein C1884_00520 [Pseudomonas sp. GW460-R15]|nr:hypothetical protein C1887_01540 [Pseudomonas sp. GW456-R21]POA71826.1 hypothetical protein C1884_00520 [Pseudomonas sp. GW460-R15]
MMFSHSLALSRIALALFLGLSPVVPYAATEESADLSVVRLNPQEQNGIHYVSGGIGLDESEALLKTQGYNLHITFSTGKENQYQSNVDVVIQSEKGNPLLSLSQVGPIVYVQLPANKYLVIASFNGHEERHTIALDGKSIGTLNLHWNE